MTVTETERKAGKSGNPLATTVKEINYEVELEINDVSFFVQNLGDETAFRSIVRRFLQNAASLTHLLAISRDEAVYFAKI